MCVRTSIKFLRRPRVLVRIGVVFLILWVASLYYYPYSCCVLLFLSLCLLFVPVVFLLLLLLSVLSCPCFAVIVLCSFTLVTCLLMCTCFRISRMILLSCSYVCSVYFHVV